MASRRKELFPNVTDELMVWSNTLAVCDMLLIGVSEILRFH